MSSMPPPPDESDGSTPRTSRRPSRNIRVRRQPEPLSVAQIGPPTSRASFRSAGVSLLASGSRCRSTAIRARTSRRDQRTKHHLGMRPRTNAECPQAVRLADTECRIGSCNGTTSNGAWGCPTTGSRFSARACCWNGRPSRTCCGSTSATVASAGRASGSAEGSVWTEVLGGRGRRTARGRSL
jgi:hypothetical protein